MIKKTLKTHTFINNVRTYTSLCVCVCVCVCVCIHEVGRDSGTMVVMSTQAIELKMVIVNSNVERANDIYHKN